MERSIVTKGALLLAVAAVTGACVSAARTGDQFELTRLGLFSTRLGNETKVEEIAPHTVIPYHVGDSCYGWFMTFEPVAETVRVEEVLSLPAAAPRWGTDQGSVVAEDRKSASTVLEFDGSTGQAEHSWCVVEGDPEGPYSFKISRDGRTLGRLAFRLERP